MRSSLNARSLNAMLTVHAKTLLFIVCSCPHLRHLNLAYARCIEDFKKVADLDELESLVEFIRVLYSSTQPPAGVGGESRQSER